MRITKKYTKKESCYNKKLTISPISNFIYRLVCESLKVTSIIPKICDNFAYPFLRETRFKHLGKYYC
jgi:hypothetical protein